jgi:hypothetical protein
MQSENHGPRPAEITTLLRGETETISAWSEGWNTRRFALHVTIIILGAGLYGAAMGWWRDPQQALYVAIKFPLIILLTTLGNALINGMLAPLLGLNIPFRQSFCAMARRAMCACFNCSSGWVAAVPSRGACCSRGWREIFSSAANSRGFYARSSVCRHCRWNLSARARCTEISLKMLSIRCNKF